MSGWLDAVCRAGVFILCAQVLVHCRPNSSYEKYLKMLVSAMILMQLFLPISRLLSDTGEVDIQEDMDWFRMQMQEMEERSGGILHMETSERAAGSGQMTGQGLLGDLTQETQETEVVQKIQETQEAQEKNSSAETVEEIENIGEIDRVEIAPIQVGGE
ncbi:MAG: stage III sporulation protein AF [Lachnospiraceae bacterium]|nr:stage III sporulation protein AF [Lachnospiraceae bacterium]